MGSITWAKDTNYSSHLTRVTTYEECLLQLFYGVTWDGDLISKRHRSEAVKNGHASQVHGWNFITESGVVFLHESEAVRA